MTRLVGIYGAGGCGRGIMPLARMMPELSAARLVWIDDGATETAINGHDVLSFDVFCAAAAAHKSAAIALADPALRERVTQRVSDAGIAIQAISAADVIIMDDVEIGEGALISPRVTFTSNIRVGRCFHANLHSIVEHDARIGDFVTFAPGVRCNGHVTIGDRAYIGAGALIRQGLSIGADAVVGMGAVVTKDVPAGATVVGNPARPLVRG
jgi:sugar O-acyltransferase (sialic acid O-acetyltransferase NeuD family)